MQVGSEIPTISGGLIPASAWNAMARTVNVLRKIALGPGLRGGATASGVFIDAQVQAVAQGFPYGSRWCFGLEIQTALSVVRIHNPLVMRSGLLVSPWFGVAGSVGDVPEPAYLEASLTWGVQGTKARTIVAHILDQTDNTESIACSPSSDIFATLPTEDGAGTVDPLRYIRTPLYILAGDVVEGSVTRPRMLVDLIHGMANPMLMG